MINLIINNQISLKSVLSTVKRNKIMKSKFLISKKFPILLFFMLLSGCDGLFIKMTQTKNTKVNEHKNTVENKHLPILEIWKKEDGSVPVRGEYLYFRLFGDGIFELDYIYETRRKDDYDVLHINYNLRRTSSYKLSDEKFRKFKLIIKELDENNNIKEEYPIVSYGFDVIIKLKILLKENDIIKKQIITNNSDYTIINKPNKFPNSLVKLVKEIDSTRVKIIGTNGYVKKL